MDEEKIIFEASFNKRIRKYIFWVVTFYLFISLIGIPFILIWLFGVGQVVSRKYYEKLECRLTGTRLEFKKGIMFRVEKTIPLENIQDLTFLDNPFLRWFDLRILKIETAGSNIQHVSDMKLIGIIDTPAFKERVLEQRTIIRNKSLTETFGPASGKDTESVELLREIRDLLKEINKERGR